MVHFNGDHTSDCRRDGCPDDMQDDELIARELYNETAEAIPEDDTEQRQVLYLALTMATADALKELTIEELAHAITEGFKETDPFKLEQLADRLLDESHKNQ